MKHLKRCAALVLSLATAIQFGLGNNFTIYADDDTAQTTEQSNLPLEEETEVSEETEQSEVPKEEGTTPQTPPAENQETAVPEQPQVETADVLVVEFVDENGTQIKSMDPISLSGKEVGKTFTLDEYKIDVEVEGYVLEKVEDVNVPTQNYPVETIKTQSFTYTQKETKLRLTYKKESKPQTDSNNNQQDNTADPTEEQEDSEDSDESDLEEEKEEASLIINYVTRNNKMEKVSIKDQKSVTVDGTKGDVVSLEKYKVDIKGYKLSKESSGLLEVTLAAGENNVDLVYEADSAANKSFVAMLADEDAVTYNITYSSNYPKGAKKYDGKNGSSATTLVDAKPTNAVYTYASGSEATIIDGFNLANATFTGWNTSPDGTGESYAPNDTLEMSENVVLYAQWTEASNAQSMTLQVRYYTSDRRDYASINVTALDLGNGQASFMLANLQDVISTMSERGINHGYDVDHFSGWIVNRESYGLNATCTTEYNTVNSGWWGQKTYYVNVYPDDDSEETTAQFFVLKREVSDTGGAVTGDKSQYYSVGSGTLKDNGPGRQIGSDSDTSGDVSEYIENAPSPAQIADILSITLEEAESVRWYVIKDQSDGYHVDGIIYKVNVNWNITFLGAKGGTQVVPVPDGGSLARNEFPEPNNPELFEGWYLVENGVATDQKIDSDLSKISNNYTLQAVYADAYSINGTFQMADGSPVVEGAVVNPATQTIRENTDSEPVVFTVPVGYSIQDVTLNGKSVPSWSDDVVSNEDGTKTYTHPAFENVTEIKNIVVTLTKSPDRKDYDDGLIKVEDNTKDGLDEINQGSITVNVYVDGVPREADHELKYAYAENAMVDVDVTLYGENADKYVINKVYADQNNPGSSNGIQLNGGVLDNVSDGSTVSIYLTSKYSVEYYLNNEKQEGTYLDETVYTYEETASQQTSHNYYPAEDLAKNINVKDLPSVGENEYVLGWTLQDEEVEPGTNLKISESKDKTENNVYKFYATSDVKKEITVVAKSDEATYDGTSHSVSGFEKTEFEIDGVKYTVSGLSAHQK